MKLALLVANRGFFPSSVIESAYSEMLAAFEKVGVEALCIDDGLTKYNAVETTGEGMVYAKFLEAHRGEYDGLVICLPNFGDENGIKAAIADVNVPILLQAYPDEIGKMDFAHRRDAFCGKLALGSVLAQMGKKYTTYTPFVVHPSSEEFHEQLSTFAATCRVVAGMKKMRVGCIGARTTAFKSVRFDEFALENVGIDVETYDLSTFVQAMQQLDDNDSAVLEWKKKLADVVCFANAPEGRELAVAKLGVVVSRLIEENQLDAIAIRCWSELQTTFGISPCSVMGILNQNGVAAVCETDVANAIAMKGLSLAAGKGAGCLDLNNNYGEELDKCILFHCGPLPMDLMTGPGHVESHKMLDKSYGPDCSWGLNVGKMKTGAVTYSGMRTENGKLQFFVDEGCITDDPVEKEFFGVPGVLQTENLQNKLYTIGMAGFHHHAAIVCGNVAQAVTEAFTKYLGYQHIGF